MLESFSPRRVAYAIAALLVVLGGGTVAFHETLDEDWLQATHDPKAVIGLEEKLTATGLGDPSPPGWVQLFFGTHPAPIDRIAMAKAWEARARGGS